MKKRGKCVRKILAAVCAVCLLTACGDQTGEQPEIQVLTIGTADSGGTMYPVGRAVAEALNEHVATLKVNTGASSGSTANVEGLRTGQIDMALVSGDVAWCAWRGTDEFDGRAMSGLRAIGALYVSLSNWMAAETLNMEYVHDLTDRRVAVGPGNSATELSARAALSAVGLTPGETITLENQGLGSGGELLTSGKLDVLYGFAGIPVKGLTDLAEKMPCRLLRFTPEELDAVLQKNVEYVRGVIPAGTYPGQDEDVETFGVKCLLCVDESMDDELAGVIARVLWESAGELRERHSALAAMADADFVCGDLPLPLHPGAAQYYQENGLLDDAG